MAFSTYTQDLFDIELFPYHDLAHECAADVWWLGKNAQMAFECNEAAKISFGSSDTFLETVAIMLRR
jgi:hypothetical protein